MFRSDYKIIKLVIVKKFKIVLLTLPVVSAKLTILPTILHSGCHFGLTSTTSWLPSWPSWPGLGSRASCIRVWEAKSSQPSRSLQLFIFYYSYSKNFGLQTFHKIISFFSWNYLKLVYSKIKYLELIIIPSRSEMISVLLVEKLFFLIASLKYGNWMNVRTEVEFILERRRINKRVDDEHVTKNINK